MSDAQILTSINADEKRFEERSKFQKFPLIV